MPNFSFEVTRKANIPSNVEDDNSSIAKLYMREEFLGKTKQKTGAYFSVCEDFELDFDNKITSQIQFRSVEDLVEAVDIIPGSGEFVYDTIIQYKTL